MKGKKECPKCKKLVGPRSLQCECGHEFEFKAKTQLVKSGIKDSSPIEQKNVSSEVVFKGGKLGIWTPAGPCPVEWEGDLSSWVDMVQCNAPQGYYFMKPALQYWLRQLVSKEEYRVLKNQIQE